MTNIIAPNTTLTGRSALAYRNFGTSSDPRVIFCASKEVETDKYYQPIWVVPMDAEFEAEEYNGVQIATINQAIFDSFRYDYDDSHIEEMIECMDIDDFTAWLENRPAYKELIADKLEEYLGDI